MGFLGEERPDINFTKDNDENLKNANQIENKNHLSPFLLNTIVRKENQEKLSYHQSLMGLISTYLPFRNYFIATTVVIIVVVSLIIMVCCIRYKKQIVDLSCVVCKFCGPACSCCCQDNTSGVKVEASDEELDMLNTASTNNTQLSVAPSQPGRTQRYVSTSLQPPPY